MNDARRLTREAEDARMAGEQRIESMIRSLAGGHVEGDDKDVAIEEVMDEIARYAADAGDPSSLLNHTSESAGTVEIGHADVDRALELWHGTMLDHRSDEDRGEDFNGMHDVLADFAQRHTVSAGQPAPSEHERFVRVASNFIALVRGKPTLPVTLVIEERENGELEFFATRHECAAPSLSPNPEPTPEQAHAAGVLAAAQVLRWADLDGDAFETVAERAVFAYMVEQDCACVAGEVCPAHRMILVARSTGEPRPSDDATPKGYGRPCLPRTHYRRGPDTARCTCGETTFSTTDDATGGSDG